MSTFPKTSLSKVSKNKTRIRGYRVEDLMECCSFGDIIHRTFTGEPRGTEQYRRSEKILSSSVSWCLCGERNEGNELKVGFHPHPLDFESNDLGADMFLGCR